MEPSFCTSVQPIPRLSIPEFEARVASDGDFPCILTDFPLPAVTFSQFVSLVRDDMQQQGESVVWGFRKNNAETHIPVPLETLVEEWTDGSTGLNVVDHYLKGVSEAVFPIPPFIDENNLLRSATHTTHYRRSLVMTSTGCYTESHVDAYGLGGFMSLFEGEKQWEFLHPSLHETLFDRSRGTYRDPVRDPVRDPPPLPSIEGFHGTLRGGETLYIPPTWIHRVRTTQRCFGFGGAFALRRHIPVIAQWCKLEQSLDIAGSMDLSFILES